MNDVTLRNLLERQDPNLFCFMFCMALEARLPWTRWEYALRHQCIDYWRSCLGLHDTLLFFFIAVRHRKKSACNAEITFSQRAIA